MFRSMKVLLSATALVCLLTPAAYAKDLRVNLVATIDNGPAMENVSWKLYRVDDAVNSSKPVPSGKPITSADNHSTHVLLPAGRYRAVATLVSDKKTITKVMDFHVRTSDSRVVVPMDK